MARVVVTGATGFMARHVIPVLADHDVVAVARKRASVMPIADTVVVDDFNDESRWHDLVSGADTVLHLAGMAHRDAGFQRRNRELYYQVNVAATLMLARTAASAGVRHFVFVSTVGVHGLSTDGREPFREDDPFDARTIYAETKAAAERGLNEIAADSGLACTIVRPPLVYGRGAPGNLRHLVSALRAGVPLPLAQIVNRRAFLGVDNLASFLRHRLSHRTKGVETFILADEEQLATPEFISLLADALGLRPRLFSCPPRLLTVALRAAGRRSVAEGLLSSLEVDAMRSRSGGWTPPLTLKEGLRHAFSEH